MKKILIAGVGNIFFGDDGFGVEVARQLLKGELPEEVQVTDFGIRSYDLAYAIMDDYEATILVDTTQRGQPPGTLTLLEPDLSELKMLDGTVVSGHGMNPVRVLHLVQSLGGEPGPLYLVGCEPAVLEPKDGRLGLSEPVEAAVPKAIDMICSLIRHLLQGRQGADLMAAIDEQTR